MSAAPRLGPLAAALAATLALSACADIPPFVCEQDEQCGDGRCEDSGACSFADDACHGGWRYGSEGGGALAGLCVGADSGPVAAIAAGSEHTCALATGGAVWCWGLDDHGGLGRGGSPSDLPRSQLPFPVVDLAARGVDGGEHHTCALDTGGGVWCWGLGERGQLGDGGNGDQTSPIQVGGLTDVTAVDVGEEQSCALGAGGSITCWGRNADHELGDGTTDDSPVPVLLPISDARSFTVNGQHGCALVGDAAEAWCWGKNIHGQLGTGNTNATAAPLHVAAFDGAVQLSAGGEHTCARFADGTVRCAGQDDNGQLGIDGNDDVATPTLIPDLLAAEIVTGDWFSCARDLEGAVTCWGSNDKGELGDGSTSVRRHPGPTVPLPRPAIALTAGEHHTCAQTDDGCLWCWGSNEQGQLGSHSDDATEPRPVMMACF